MTASTPIQLGRPDGGAGGTGRPRLVLTLLTFVVVAAVLITHWPALSSRVLLFDDDLHVTGCALVQNPSWDSGVRFFGEVREPSVGGYYKPLAMTALMLDRARADGPDDLRPFRQTSLALHAANTALLIVLTFSLFRQPVIAALIGLLFGVHPFTVEAIPWAAERKNLLAAFFSLACLVLYVRFAHVRRWPTYGAALASYTLALLSKPTAVSLALALLLLDWWPLRRLSWRAVLEKVPFFILAVVSAAITFVSQTTTLGGALPTEQPPLRIPLTVCHNIVFYLYQLPWPWEHSAYYAAPEPLALSHPMVLTGVMGTALLLAGLLLAVRWTRAPLAGWLFFFVTIAPTLGVVGFTDVIAADRFAYIPAMGLLLPLAGGLTRWWGAAAAPRTLWLRRGGMVVIAASLAVVEAGATRAYLWHWRDTEALYRYMLARAPHAAKLHYNLGWFLAREARLDEAIPHLKEALTLDPYHAKAYFHLGAALHKSGHYQDALAYYREAVHCGLKDYRIHQEIARAYADDGQLEPAVASYREVLQLKPGHTPALYELANTLARLGRYEEAVPQYEELLRRQPDHASAHNHLGNALAESNRLDEAVQHYREALRLKPDYVAAHYNLGVVLERVDQLDNAITEYRAALQREPNHAGARAALDAALRKRGGS